jgi:ATP-dependent DNA helicase RecQ
MKFRPVVELTPTGAAVMKGEQLPPNDLEDLLPRRSVEAVDSSRVRISRRNGDAPEEFAESDPEVSDRFERLRALRARIAREKSVPAYVICHDTTLKQIAMNAPADLTGLQRVKGMGPQKIKMYGQALLDAVNRA